MEIAHGNKYDDCTLTCQAADGWWHALHHPHLLKKNHLFLHTCWAWTMNTSNIKKYYLKGKYSFPNTLERMNHNGKLVAHQYSVWSIAGNVHLSQENEVLWYTKLTQTDSSAYIAAGTDPWISKRLTFLSYNLFTVRQNEETRP